MMNPKVAILSTYPPTQCGIATFAQSLVRALSDGGTEVGVVRLVDRPQHRPSEVVVHQHIAGVPPCATAMVLNSYDVVIIQHEFGIFDGADGDEVLGIMAGVRVPMILVAHTVIKNPRIHQRHVFQHAVDLASVVVTMTEAGRRNLIRSYPVDQHKVRVIPHGSADLRSARGGLGHHESPIILTWGLLGRGKGIEWGIDALSLLRAEGFQARYVIAGQTHPKVLQHEGERYRDSLKSRVSDLALGDAVDFIDDYLNSEALAKVIEMADILLLPYDSSDQVTSGVLIEAVVTGKPVVSTRFPHATELLGDGSGALVDQADPDGIARELRRIITDRDHAASMCTRARAKGEQFLWPSIARDYRLLTQALTAKGGLRLTERTVGLPALAVS